MLVFAICWYLLHDLHVVYLRMSQDPVNFPRPICQRSLWHHQDPARHPTAAAACCMSKDVLLSVAVLLGVEWVPPELAQSRLPAASTLKPYNKEEQRGCTMLKMRIKCVTPRDMTWYDMICLRYNKIIVCSSRFICEVYGCSVSVALHAISQELCCRGGVGPSGAGAAERAPEAALAAEHNSSKRILTDWNYLHVHR